MSDLDVRRRLKDAEAELAILRESVSSGMDERDRLRERINVLSEAVVHMSWCSTCAENWRDCELRELIEELLAVTPRGET